MTSASLPDPKTDAAGFVLAACDLREARINAATAGTWEAFTPGSEGWEVREVVPPIVRRRRRIVAKLRGGEWAQDRADAVHIAAEANPAHALAEVALWRGTAERHEPYQDWCGRCQDRGGVVAWPCPDLLAVVAAARAYLTGTGG